MMLGGIFSFMLAPFVATGDIPAACSFTPRDSGGAEISLTIQPGRSDLQASRARLEIEGMALEARVRQNGATSARDVLMTAADGSGGKIVLALNESGRAVLVRQAQEGRAEQFVGRCGISMADLSTWLLG